MNERGRASRAPLPERTTIAKGLRNERLAREFAAGELQAWHASGYEPEDRSSRLQCTAPRLGGILSPVVTWQRE